MENTRVQNTYSDVVDTNVASLQNKKAVFHDSEAHIAFGVATVGKLVFVEVYLAIYLYWIVFSEHLHWQIFDRRLVTTN